MEIENWKLLFGVFLLLHLIHRVLDESAIGFDHVGHEGEDEELESDDEEAGVILKSAR